MSPSIPDRFIHFPWRDGELHAESVPLAWLAEEYGTPLYVYSETALRERYRAFDQAFGSQPHTVCYAVKANSNLSVLQALAQEGAGFDIVSVGELERVLAAGGDPSRVVFSGVAKRHDEIARALEAGIKSLNVESAAELARIAEVAQAHGVVAPVSVRVNPDVDAKTHPYISTGLKENKFGVDIATATQLYREAAAHPHLQPVGLDCHIGSQLTELTPFRDAVARVMALLDTLRQHDITLHHLDLGGGLGVQYRDEQPPAIADYVRTLVEAVSDPNMEIIIEPGRAIAANAGVLLTRVEYLKHNEDHHFAIVDAGMNDLIRPALYQAWQDIVPVQPHKTGTTAAWDIVGPVCETGDFLGKGRELTLQAQDLLAVMSAGAYGFTMASNYNTRPRAAEVMVKGEHARLIRPREDWPMLFGSEAACLR
ncbi:diaminopimelate decarboxylase [Sulfurivirga caldicuralii]|uniref:Diaminopimelate decarboxylase n=1 Tax=Sulfurivirga caldicuralii TaxID=364032 RepID=A0A1N6GM31_9GAMM|nr:diaminopimelate decarboxylase [Sulfurivirga caldicuralii]SIO08559.1 diaminopimelate decarboxylase [Sulfurivirga caldicuralii]